MTAINIVTLMGRVGRPPRTNYTTLGKVVSMFGLMVPKPVAKERGEWVARNAYVECVGWGGSAETMGQFLKPGMTVLVSGFLHLNQWETKDGKKRQRLQVWMRQLQIVIWDQEKAMMRQAKRRPRRARDRVVRHGRVEAAERMEGDQVEVFEAAGRAFFRPDADGDGCPSLCEPSGQAWVDAAPARRDRGAAGQAHGEGETVDGSHEKAD